jgi:hypothetical protein
VGVWDDVGRTGWGPDGTRAIFEVNEAPHRTDAGHRSDSLLTPEQRRRVDDAYRADIDFVERLTRRAIGRDLGRPRGPLS